MEKIFTARTFLKYKLSAKSRHHVHSPFVYDLLDNVINDNSPFYGYELVEALRAKNLLDESEVSIADYGTGEDRKEKISQIAGKSVMAKKYSQLLFRLVNKFQPVHILEIGTSLGLTTIYLSLASSKSKVITLEGSEEIGKIASKNFSSLKRNNIELIIGEFDYGINQAISKTKNFDFVLFDGNHTQDATLSYFGKCLAHANENSVFVFDDIHWSREMENAWQQIKQHPSVSTSIDLFQIGIIFFRKGMSREQFVLKF